MFDIKVKMDFDPKKAQAAIEGAIKKDAEKIAREVAPGGEVTVKVKNSRLEFIGPQELADKALEMYKKSKR